MRRLWNPENQIVKWLFNYLIMGILMVVEAENYEHKARVFAALSDPTRLKLVHILATEDTLCGSDLAERANISLALLSHHWKVLTEAGLTTRTRHGQRQYCSLNRESLAEAFEGLWPYRKLSDRPAES